MRRGTLRSRSAVMFGLRHSRTPDFPHFPHTLLEFAKAQARESKANRNRIKTGMIPNHRRKNPANPLQIGPPVPLHEAPAKACSITRIHYASRG
jgi:hypothetical protein